MQGSAGSSAATSAARCSSRGESSSEPPTSSSDTRASRLCSVALAGDDIGFVEKPKAAMFLQDLAGGVQVAGVAQHFGQAHVVHLRDIDGGVPGGEQGRGAE